MNLRFLKKMKLNQLLKLLLISQSLILKLSPIGVENASEPQVQEETPPQRPPEQSDPQLEARL